jgi:hypothetical protein
MERNQLDHEARIKRVKEKLKKIYLKNETSSIDDKRVRLYRNFAITAA